MFKFDRLVLAALMASAPLGPLAAQENPETNPLIVGGNPVGSISEVPWQVAIVRHGTRNQFCGGTLVAANWVLTAAHCVDNPIINGDPGTLDIVAGTLTYATGGTQAAVSEIHINPDWDAASFDFDAALLKLTSPLTLGSDINVIPLNASSVTLPVGIEVRVSGWGATSQGGPGSPSLLEVSVPVVATDVCNAPASYNGAITAEMYCAGEQAGGKDSCQGDSGGPSDAEVQGTDTLVGIVSWGQGCAQRLKYGVYTRVSRISDWAAKTMGK